MNRILMWLFGAFVAATMAACGGGGDAAASDDEVATTDDTTSGEEEPMAATEEPMDDGTGAEGEAPAEGGTDEGAAEGETAPQ